MEDLGPRFRRQLLLEMWASAGVRGFLKEFVDFMLTSHEPAIWTSGSSDDVVLAYRKTYGINPGKAASEAGSWKDGSGR